VTITRQSGDFVLPGPLLGSQRDLLPNCYREGNGVITSGSRDFETREILVQNGAGRPEIGGGGWGLAGSQERNAFESRRYKTLRHNALRRRVSGGFWGDNLGVGWVRYGLESVREADAKNDLGVMGGGHLAGW